MRVATIVELFFPLNITLNTQTRNLKTNTKINIKTRNIQLTLHYFHVQYRQSSFFPLTFAICKCISCIVEEDRDGRSSSDLLYILTRPVVFQVSSEAMG